MRTHSDSSRLAFLLGAFLAVSAIPILFVSPALAQNSSSGLNASAPAGCPAKFDDSLETDGIATDFDNGVKPPRTIYQPEAKLSDEARRAAHREIENHQTKVWEKVVVLSMIVGEDGVPRDFCVREAAGYGLESQAVKAAAQYRFKPATSQGKPVRARISLEVSFKIR